MQKQVQVVEILHLLLLVLHGVQPMYSPGVWSPGHDFGELQQVEGAERPCC
jgi:hypothetical protein